MSWGGWELLVSMRLVFGACCAYSRHERHERSNPPYYNIQLGLRVEGLGLGV